MKAYLGIADSDGLLSFVPEGVVPVEHAALLDELLASSAPPRDWNAPFAQFQERRRALLVRASTMVFGWAPARAVLMLAGAARRARSDLDRASAARLSSVRLALVLLDAPANVGLGVHPRWVGLARSFASRSRGSAAVSSRYSGC